MRGALPNILLDLAHQAGKFILRDYIELELLQSSNNKVRFLTKSLEKSKECITTFFADWLNFQIVFTDENSSQLSNQAQSICYVCPIDSIDNFLNSVPQFGMVFFLTKKFIPNKASKICLIHFPILQESIYAVEGEGAFYVKYGASTKIMRLKFSDSHSFKDPLNPITAIEGMKDINRDMKEDISILRTYGSYAFSSYLVLRKKLSNAILIDTDFAIKEAIKLLFQEAGLRYLEQDNKLLLKSTFK
jgi:fructose-1,6-bisphosphatase/inositol monophosphatase family enzyme